MNWWQAVILGVVQGVTEFLPISSDGHLALAERFLGLTQLPLTFDIMVHAGTLVAILYYFREQIIKTTLSGWLRIAAATIPVVLLGLVLKPMVGELKHSPAVVTMGFLYTAFLLFIADILIRSDMKWWKKQPQWYSLGFQLWQWWQTSLQRTSAADVPSYVQAVSVGLLQVLAILPGVSRSASTVTAGVLVGLEREVAFRFAFLIGIPAITGAVVLDLFDVWQTGQIADHPWGLYFLGALVSAVVGLGSLKLFELVIQRSKLQFFAWYCLFVGILSFLFA